MAESHRVAGNMNAACVVVADMVCDVDHPDEVVHRDRTGVHGVDKGREIHDGHDSPLSIENGE